MAARLCEICKRPIEEGRAEAILDTRLCPEHGREIARFGGEFIVSAEQERTSKAGSLKLKYGGITTARTRNTAAVAKLRDDWEGRN